MVNSQSQFNADELVAPDWLNEAFFVKFLEKAENANNIKVIQLKLTPGTSKNDHYASIMFRAKLNYEVEHGSEKTKSFIIKTLPILEGPKKDLLKDRKLFETEIRMYTEALPKIEAELRKYGDETKLCAKVFYYTLEPRKCIIFEDLVEEGYTTISNRHASMEEVKSVFLKLAKLHAVSYKLEKEGDQVITNFRDGAFATENITDWFFIKNAITEFSKLLSKYEDLQQYILPLKNIETKLLQDITNLFNAYHNGERNGIFVLNHGDLHIKNMMIKTKNEELKDLMLLDFQICQFGSPAIDLIYAFIMFLSPKMRSKHRNELIYFYFTNFQATLKTIQYQGHIPTMMELQVELLKYGHWELLLTISFLIFNYLFVDSHGDVAKSIEDSDYRFKTWETTEIINELRILLPSMLYRGCFEE